MTFTVVFAFCCLIVVPTTSIGKLTDTGIHIPEKILLGFASSAFQIEGAWNEDGKSESIWDTYFHDHPDLYHVDDTGDVATDFYHKFKEDVQLLKEMNAQVYRLSLSWSRILPKGDASFINQKAIMFYKNVIKELKDNGIEPMVTLYHWDLPQTLQELGGWTNPEMTNYFHDFADVAFSHLGPHVKWWSTFNEPLVFCWLHYGQGIGPLNLGWSGVADYLCGHNVLLAHAKAYHLYNDTYRAWQNGSVGISNAVIHCEPRSDSESDAIAAEENYQFLLGWFAHPIFSAEGDYPAVMRQRVDANSQAEGRPRSRLPVFTPEEILLIQGSADFFGVNHYTTFLSSKVTIPLGPSPSFLRDMETMMSQDSSWPATAMLLNRVVPWGLGKTLKWIKNEYNNPPIYITENGFADSGSLDDSNRINYHNEYLHVMVDTLMTENITILGYTAWTLVDNVEWTSGFSLRFGAYHLELQNRTRHPKSSVSYFKDVFTHRKLPPLSSTPRID